MCCATNRTNPFAGNSSNGDTADACLPNGLCINVAERSIQMGLWRISPHIGAHCAHGQNGMKGA